ncbi:MAG: hypothetical protein IPG97_14675 [Microthrixaceae bacterium]|jgi:hypothetical protein|nr:hypothetical protein [Microthrixaceae bacterium]
MTPDQNRARRARPPLEAERPQHPAGPALILVLVVVLLIVALSVASVYT